MPRTLLVADDSVTVQRVVELTFADEDMTVVAVGDGNAAIAKLENSAVDVVLADTGMPGPNGYDIAAYVRRSARLSHIPVILMTGAFEPVDDVRARDGGCDVTLAKPFEPQRAVAVVRELLAREPERRESAPPEPAAPKTEQDALPSLAEAFAAFLAAEERGEIDEPIEWPAAAPAQLSDAALDAVVRRVVARLSEPIVREAVAGVVSIVAERMVREEIERIKAEIK